MFLLFFSVFLIKLLLKCRYHPEPELGGPVSFLAMGVHCIVMYCDTFSLNDLNDKFKAGLVCLH